MPTNLDIWQAANILVRQHGDKATGEAHKHLAAVIARGDAEGEAVWRRVLETIPRLLAMKSDGEVN